MWKERKKYGIIFAGAVLYAFSVALILKPNQLAPGGASGLAIMISYFTGIKTGTIILILNIPLIISGVRSFGKEFSSPAGALSGAACCWAASSSPPWRRS